MIDSLKPENISSAWDSRLAANFGTLRVSFFDANPSNVSVELGILLPVLSLAALSFTSTESALHLVVVAGNLYELDATIFLLDAILAAAVVGATIFGVGISEIVKGFFERWTLHRPALKTQDAQPASEHFFEIAAGTLAVVSLTTAVAKLTAVDGVASFFKIAEVTTTGLTIFGDNNSGNGKKVS